MAEDATAAPEAAQEPPSASEAHKPTCQSCGTPDVSRAALVASSGLKGLPQPGRDWMAQTYGAVPSVLCSACFIPALTNANNAWFATLQAPA